MHSQSARDVYYRFTLHYKKENLVAERNLSDFFYYLRPRNRRAVTDSNMKIPIDNGHGIQTPGKRSPDGKLLEYAYTREIARRIVSDLTDRGYDAELLVPEEDDIPLSERVRRVNEICLTYEPSSPATTGDLLPNVILISLHINASATTSRQMFPLKSKVSEE